MGIYAADGSIRVTVVNGSTRTGLYAPDGSWYVVDATNITTPVGVYHNCGAYNVSNTISPVLSAYAPNGSRYVTTNNSKGAQRVTIVSGSLGGTTLWTPILLAGSFFAWWKADSLPNGVVASWVDTINGLTPVQATGISQPIRSATSFNGYPGVTFDGVDDYLAVESVGTLPVSSTPSEIWVVCAPGLVGSHTTMSYGGGANPGARRIVVNEKVFTARSDVSSSSLLLEGTSAIAVGLFDSNGVTCRLNGSSGTKVSGVTATGAVRVRLGATTLSAGPNIFFEGTIRHLIVTAVLSESNRLKLEGHLAHESGIQSSLAIGHPYKVNPPTV